MRNSIRIQKKLFKKGIQINDTYNGKVHTMNKYGFFMRMCQNFVNWGIDIPTHCGKIKSKFSKNSAYTKEVISSNISQREHQKAYIANLRALWSENRLSQ